MEKNDIRYSNANHDTAVNTLIDRISALTDGFVNLNTSNTARAILEGMAIEETAKYNRLIETIEFTYNFTEGGWNTQFAKTREEALKLANERWADSEKLNINEDSFRYSTPAEIQRLTSDF